MAVSVLTPLRFVSSPDAPPLPPPPTWPLPKSPSCLAWSFISAPPPPPANPSPPAEPPDWPPFVDSRSPNDVFSAVRPCCSTSSNCYNIFTSRILRTHLLLNTHFHLHRLLGSNQWKNLPPPPPNSITSMRVTPAGTVQVLEVVIFLCYVFLLASLTLRKCVYQHTRTSI